MNKKQPRENIEEIKKEQLKSIVGERLEDDELIQRPENVLNLQDAMTWVTQYEKQLKTEKQKSINIGYHQGYILNKFKESQESIDTITQNLKNSKSTIIFKT